MTSSEQVQPNAIQTVALPTAAGRSNWFRGSLAATAVDEALLSGLSLALALALIRGSSKAEYGAFALVNGLIMLLRGGQNALVITPLLTIGGRMTGDERATFVLALGRLQAWFGIALAVAITIGFLVFMGAGAHILALGSGLALGGAWLREYRRAAAFLEGRSAAALAGDSVYAMLTIVAVLAAWAWADTLSAGPVLAATGIAAAMAALVAFPATSCTVTAQPHDRGRIARMALDQGRWSLPGMLVSWGQNSGYSYAVGIALGSAAVGEIAAARLFLVPLLLTGVAWNRMFLPRAAGLLSAGGETALVAQCRHTLRIVFACSMVYLTVLLIAWTLGLGQVLPPAYSGCEGQVLAWGGYAVVNLTRSIATTALLARLEFRLLFAAGAVSAILSLLLVFALIGPLGGIGAIIGITCGEIVFALASWRRLLTPQRV